MKRLGAVLVSLALGSAAATTLKTLTLPEAARKAEVIVRATLGAPQTFSDAGLNYVAYPLTVLETVVGDAASIARAPATGAAGPALIFLAGLDGLPELTSGQEVLALLYRAPAGARPDSNVVGFNAGLYPVTGAAVDAGEYKTLAALRDAVLKARSGQ